MLKLTALAQTLPKMETLVIPVCEDADIHDHPQLRELIAQAKSIREFSGEKGQQLTLYRLLEGTVGRAQFCGLGKASDLDSESLRAMAGRTVKNAMQSKVGQITFAAPVSANIPVAPEAVVRAMLEGACLGNHVFDKYKATPKQTPLKKIALLLPPALVKQHDALAAQIEGVCRAAVTAREWVSLPANDKPPTRLAQMFGQAARGAGIEVEILSQAQLKQRKFNALLAVAAGSVHPPCLVEMRYQATRARKTIVLVGKGVTFDSGGINLKPAQSLETMKCDMAGAAAVAAAMTAVAALKPRLNVIGITPLVENMPSGKATRPGDVVTSYAGKTVEIENTDAEGRLILIDAMAYAIEKYRPDLMIDLATLTGACIVALGEKIAGLFSRDDALAEAIADAGEAVFERCWRLPLPEDYQELIKSELADLSNMSSSRYGGAITAALFLSEFTSKTSWAHLDIAGPAYSKKGSDYCGPGGTGFGVRLLCRLMENLSTK